MLFSEEKAVPNLTHKSPVTGEKVLPGNLLSFLERISEQFPEKSALKVKFQKGYHTHTYQNFYDQVLRFSSGLLKLGLRPGDRVALLADNSAEWLITFFGITSVGGIAVPMDPHLTEVEIDNLIQDCTPSLLACSSLLYQKLRTISEKWAFLKKMITLDSEESEKSEERCVSYISLLKNSPYSPHGEVQPNDPAAIMYTSGTTGNPKGAVLTHGNFIWEAFNISEFSPYFENDRGLFVLPLFHIYTLSAVLAFLSVGALSIFLLNFRGEEIFSVLQENAVTVIIGVPRLFESLFRGIADKFLPSSSQSLPSFLKGSLRTLISGGGKLPLEIGQLISKLGFLVQEGYGLTETTGGVTLNPLDKVKLGSVGRVTPINQIKIINQNPEGIGEIVISGPTVFHGYFKNPTLTQEVLQDGWYYTGDLGLIDQEGYIFITGRKKDLIVLSSGKNVYPEEVESFYSKSPYIKQIGVMGIHRNGKEEVFAVIVPLLDQIEAQKRDNRGFIEEKIREEIARISQQISPHKRITHFQISDQDLSSTRMGKVKRHQLAEFVKKEETLSKKSFSEIPFASQEKGELEKTVFALLNKRFPSSQTLGPQSHLELDLGIDSLGRTELIAALEKIFHLRIPDEEVVKLQTVGDIVHLIGTHLPPSLSKDQKDEGGTIAEIEDDTIPDRLHFGREGQQRRLAWLAEKTKVSPEYLPQTNFDPALFKGNIEHFIGMAQVPVGIAGPLRLEGESARGTFYVPMATTEGALIASVTRGMMVITRSGGAHARVLEDQIMRAPVFLFNLGSQAEAFTDWLKENFHRIKTVAESTTRTGKLKRLEYFPLGRRVSVRFIYTSGDASGQNMVTMATEAACQFIQKEQPIPGWQTYFLDANLSGDKKMSMINFFSARGKKVYAEAVLKRDVLRHFLHTTPEEVVAFHKEGALGSLQAGIWGLNAHYANTMAAIFIATGQDVACVHEASTGITVAELNSEGDLYVSVTLPNLIIATVGGGTGKGTQHECLELLGCAGSGKVNQLAEIIAGSVLAGEISIIGAHAAHDFAQAHNRLGRNRPPGS